MASRPLTLDSRSTARIWMVILGTAVIVASFATPWWTRGMNFADNNDDNNATPGMEGVYFHYGAFSTPGGDGVSTDASRETVTGLLGVLMVASGLFVAASLFVRYLRNRGTIEASSSAPVGLAIAGFGLGVAAVLTGLLFVPLMGSDPGFIYGNEESGTLEQDSDGFLEATRYANAGFFFGILAFIVLPTLAWVDAAAARQRFEAADAQTESASSPATGAKARRTASRADGTVA